MAGQKMKLGYLEETPWFPKLYICCETVKTVKIGWIGLANCNQMTSTKYVHSFKR